LGKKSWLQPRLQSTRTEVKGSRINIFAAFKRSGGFQKTTSTNHKRFLKEKGEGVRGKTALSRDILEKKGESLDMAGKDHHPLSFNQRLEKGPKEWVQTRAMGGNSNLEDGWPEEKRQGILFCS